MSASYDFKTVLNLLRAQIATREEEMRILSASRDAYRAELERSELALAIQRNSHAATYDLYQEEVLRHANTRRQAREDTEELHERLQSAQKRLRELQELVNASKGLTQPRRVRQRVHFEEVD